MRSLYVDYGGYMFRNLLRTLLSLLFLLFFLLEHIGNLLLTCYFLRPSERICLVVMLCLCEKKKFNLNFVRNT